MPLTANGSRAQVWLEGIVEWSWPGEASAAVEVLPPPWVPAFPPRHDRDDAPSGSLEGPPRRSIMPALLLSALAALAAGLALRGQLPLGSWLGLRQRTARAPAAVIHRAVSAPVTFSLRPLPALARVSSAASGSVIEHARFHSVSVHAPGGFLVYLPPGFSPVHRYPVLYLLHGNEQLAVEFLLQGDLQGELDRLIAARQVPPMIAVMPEGGRGAINWRDLGSQRWESYVVEVQELVDRMLPTVPERDARAIAGDSMGAYGAMNVALGNPYRFGVVESWLGFFNGLGPELHTDGPVIRRLGLHAFVYGGEEDHIANPDEDEPFAAALRAAGADATAAIYPGEHNMQTVQEHLASQLIVIGRAFREAARHRPS